jgi:hypothetical protein
MDSIIDDLNEGTLKKSLHSKVNEEKYTLKLQLSSNGPVTNSTKKADMDFGGEMGGEAPVEDKTFR